MSKNRLSMSIGVRTLYFLDSTYIMRKQWFCVTLIAVLLLSGDCLYPGDSCVGEEQRAGSCVLLVECQPLLIDIHRAGSPMPMRLRMRLHKLACGFHGDEPLVCCVTSFTNNITPPDPNESIQGMGGDAEWTRNTQRPNTGDQNQQINAGPPNIKGHRNLRLLPTDCGVQTDSDRLVGATKAQLFDHPWMVLLAYNTGRGVELNCGGTLITERYVLTAAHCVSLSSKRLTLSGVVLGEFDVTKDPDCLVGGYCAPNVRNVTIEKVILHPRYGPQNLLYDDIALVKLAEPADFTLESMKPICLPSTAELQAETLVGLDGVVAGWGATEDGLQSPILLTVELPIVSNKECHDAYNGTPKILERQICAGGIQNKDSCAGDSGGPLMFPGRISTGAVRNVQRGIVSYGTRRCGIGGYPGVYTRIGHYMDWILDNIDS